VVVVGAGHAGCEPGGLRAHGPEDRALHLNVDLIAQMSMQPSRRWHRQSHLVREVDALAASWAKSPMLWESSSGCLTLRVPGRLVSARPVRQAGLSSKNARSARIASNLKIKQAEVADLIIEESSIAVIVRKLRFCLSFRGA